ncbi:MAG: hypothetical protein HY080_14985 [Gammaproteobacteria bacterium]|nr:hypothetical protein [Gammaproteobacteria bacterium]
MPPLALKDWNKRFAPAIQKIALPDRLRAGVLLPIIPEHSQWDGYLSSVRVEWEKWKTSLWQHPSCLLLLYAGLAFYEYDENTFWPQFAKAVGSKPLPANQQQELNGAFAKAAKYFSLKLKLRDNGTDFVGSAIHYIGIPLSLWDGFLDICEWALWQKDWKMPSDEEWSEVVEKRAGGRRRLRKFMTDNRESACSFVQEMLDAHEILTKDVGLTIGNIAQASILRVEYFDEVPETAEFLRPQNPDSLFQDRARLIWNERRKQICLQLPGVERGKLPAIWHIGAHSQAAAHGPDELVLNLKAFCDPLLLTLKSGSHNETQRLRGVASWGLFDMEGGGRLVNADRDEIPLKSFTLVSRTELEIFRDGFDEDENPVNEQFELADGTRCFVTRLWPTGKFAELRIGDHGRATRTIQFRTRAKIEARFFAGQGEYAAYFSRIQDFVKIERWPVLCVSIPHGYFRDNKAELAKKFEVFIDDKLAGGQWEQPTQDSVREYYLWKWSSNRPVIEQVKTGSASGLQELGKFFHSPPLKGNRILSVKSPEFTVHYKIYKDDPKRGMGKCWKDLPGAFLPMFLLCQSTEGMKWEDLVLAKDVIAPGLRLSPYLLHKYTHHGFLVQRGHRWFINESRAELRSANRDQCQMKYCGDPSVLWGLYRRMYHQILGTDLPFIEVVNNRGEIPYLQATWPLHMRGDIEHYFKHHKVVIGAILWSH